jgi:hypothetical protein
MKIISLNNVKCAIQAYKKDDFVNICPLQEKPKFNEVLGNIRIDFVSNKIETSGKETFFWKQFVSKININEIKIIIDEAAL